VLALVHNVVVVLLALVVGGTAWLLTLSTLNASMQLSLPAWVRARGLSVYQLIFMGGQAMGSLVWGCSPGPPTVPPACWWRGAAVGVRIVVCVVAVARGHLRLDLTPSSHWPEPTLLFEPEPLDGPVLVLTSYRIAPEDEEGFLAALAVLGRSRQRTGASQWRVFRSVEHESTFVETFVVRSWGEHMHQHYTRLTGQDRLVEEAVERYVDGVPVSEHYLAVR
jgi:hypothetical protein